MKTVAETLTEMNACADGVAYARKFGTDWNAAWNECPRGDHMLWLLGKTATEADRKNLVLIACECARLALPYTKDPRVLACIETTEQWTRGEATIKQVREARRNAAYDAAAYAYAYAYAAAAAADAAYADAGVGGAYADAAYAAYAAAYAYAADAAARCKTHKQCAEIVRKYHPTAPTL